MSYPSGTRVSTSRHTALKFTTFEGIAKPDRIFLPQNCCSLESHQHHRLLTQLLYTHITMRILSSSASALLLAAASSLLPTVLGHNIQLPSHGRECFHEELHKDDKMTVTFQVGDREFGSAGNLDIDFWV